MQNLKYEKVISIKKIIVYALMLLMILSAGCASKNEVSNKPVESKIYVSEVSSSDNLGAETKENQTALQENESAIADVKEETDYSIDTVTEPNSSAEQTTDTTILDGQTEEITEANNTDPVAEETTTETDSSLEIGIPEEDYNYVIADVNEEESVETIAANTVDEPKQENAVVISKDNTEKSWWYSPKKDHTQPSAAKDIDIGKFDSYYVGEDSKRIYLTFDEGYENGYTPKILDILKENNVPAAFFVTKPFVTSQPHLIKRMADEGHLVCNHSVTHPNLTTKTDAEIMQEIKGVEDAVNEVTGRSMAKFFRPPAGVYSERVLSVLQSQGYKTVFWSFAHRDWELDNQPPVETTIQRVMDNHHNGMILLIHAVSQSNTDALDTIIKNLKDLGYEFMSLENLN